MEKFKDGICKDLIDLERRRDSISRNFSQFYNS